MKLPNTDRAEVKREKLVGYRLSRAHPDGASKAVCFEVEFVTLDGETLSVVTLERDRVRPVRHGEIAHVRAVRAAWNRNRPATQAVSTCA